MITPKELALYIKLQKPIAEAMGDVIPLYDRFLYNGEEFVPLEVKFFNDKRLPKWWGVLMRHEKLRILGEDWVPIKVCIRLPLPIDPRNPERGLWGMVDWSQWHGLVLKDGGLRMWNNPEKLKRVVFEDWPTLALLRALEKQWEVEG